MNSRRSGTWSVLAIAAVVALSSLAPQASAQDRKSRKAAAEAQQQESVRPETGEILKVVQDALAAKDYPTALAKLDEAEAVAGLTSYERYIIDRMRGSAAVAVGDTETAIKSFNAVVASSHLPPEEKVPTLDAVARLSFSARNFPATIDAIQKYRAAGGDKPETLEILAQALYLSQRYREAAQELDAQIRAAEAAGQVPSKQQIELLASCALKLNELPPYLSALRTMVTYYPDRNYWLDLIVRTAQQRAFSSRLDLDVYRLRAYTGALEGAADYVEAVELSLRAGLPGEADRLYKEGEKAGKLGKSGDLARQQRLKGQVAREIEKDKPTLAEGERLAARLPNGDALVASGLNRVMYGEYERGLELMNQGIAKPLERPGEAKLRLGYAYAIAGQTAKANEVLAGIQEKDGTSDLAGLWLIALKAR